MKLAYKDIEGYFDYENNNTYCLTIENKKKFRKIIQELNDQIEKGLGDFILSEKDKEINFSKNAFIFFDFLNLETSSTFQRQIIKGLENIYLDTTLGEELINLKGEINSRLENLILDYDYDLETEIVEIEDLLKILKPKLIITGNLQVDLLNYMKFVSHELKNKLIILINLKTYLSPEEVDKFLYQLQLENIKVLLIESTFIKNEYEKRVIIDQDLCQINS